jgi:molybdopterin converting factor small subunit
MMIDVQFLGYLAKYSPTGKETFKLEVGSDGTVSQLLARLKFPIDIEKMVLVNGRQANPSTPLAEGDEVFIFAPAAGG